METLTPETEIEKDLSLLAQKAENELNNIILGKDFSTMNLSEFKARLLNIINNPKEDSEQTGIQNALSELTPTGKSSKTFDVEVQIVADMFDEIITNPNDYRIKYPSKVKSLIAFCQGFR